MHAATDGSVLLARCGGLGDVSLCTCGVVSLNLGGVTVRMQSTALPQLHRLLEEAVHAMCRMAGALEDDRGAVRSVH